MAKFRTIDIDNDWNFGRGLQDYSQNADAVKLDIKTRLQEWVGDFFGDTSRGIDWINRLRQTNQQKLLDQDIRRIILQTNNVASLNSFTYLVVDRVFTATYNITTTFSQTFIDSINRTY